MAQGSRQVQTQAQQQIQTLSPQQILVVKLLELPTVELEERIHSEILDNPALEEGKEMPENEDDNTEYVENEDGNTDSNEDFSLRNCGASGPYRPLQELLAAMVVSQSSWASISPRPLKRLISTFAVGLSPRSSALTRSRSFSS